MTVKEVKKAKLRSKESHLFKEVVSILDFMVERKQIGMLVMLVGAVIIFLPDFTQLVSNPVLGFGIAVLGAIISASD